MAIEQKKWVVRHTGELRGQQVIESKGLEKKNFRMAHTEEQGRKKN